MQLESIKINEVEARALSWIEDQSEKMIKTVIDWANINSGSYAFDGLNRVRTEIKQHFSELEGAEISEKTLDSWIEIDQMGQKQERNTVQALQIKNRPNSEVKLVLTGHYDTVFPEESTFQHCRYLDSERLNGPGVADMKGGIIVMLYALRAFEMTAFKNKIGYDILLSPDEEIGSPASARLLQILGKKADFGMTYEPCLSTGQMAGARKGSGNFSLIIRGKSAHAGREPDLGRNAILSASRFVLELQNLNHKREGLTLNPARIEGGSALNIVPDLAIVRFNIRLKQIEDQAWVYEKINKIMNKIAEKDQVEMHLEGRFSRSAKPMSLAIAQGFQWLKQAGNALNIEISWKDTGGVCEGNNLYAAGCPNIDTLGVKGDKIHSENEYVILSSFVERAKLSALMLMKFASGEFDLSRLK